MDDILSHSERVPRDALRRLQVRSDAPGLARLLASLAALIVGGTAACILAAHDDPWWPLASTLCALAIPALFAALHESAHGTAFGTPLLNRATAWIGGALMLQSPSFFREFHWEHHRQTQSKQRDPEIHLGAGILGEWPRSPLLYLALASGQLFLVGKPMFTLACALLPISAWRRIFPWVRESHARAVARESRLVVALLAAAVALGLHFVPGFRTVLLAWPIGHVLLGLYLMAEHTGLPHDGSQLHRTRTMATTAAVRWWMWNMPYHGEHHAYPSVPFHALPQLHALLAPELEHADQGYLAFHREALLRSLVRRP